MKTKKIKVLIFPRAKNPYQTLLTQRYENQCTYTYLELVSSSRILGIFSLFPQLLTFRIKGFSHFHLHWVDFMVSNSLPLAPFISFISTITILLFIKSLGYKIIWTVHNIIPHDKVTFNDLLITKLLLIISSGLIVHSNDTKTKLISLGSNDDKITIIPHGNFTEQYPNIIQRNIARKSLKIDKNKFVFLFFGQIREYKGINQLITNYLTFSQNHSDTYLILKGKCPDAKYERQLNNMLKGVQGVLFDPTHSLDQEVQTYYNSADVVILPFTRISTSGSAILALSFAKAIIAPRIGSITDIPNDVGYFYDPNNHQGLREAMESAYKERNTLTDKGKRGYNYIRQFTWEDAAKKTLEVYRKALR